MYIYVACCCKATDRAWSRCFILPKAKMMKLLLVSKFGTWLAQVLMGSGLEGVRRTKIEYILSLIHV